MTVTCLVGLATYLRLRLAVGQLSLQIDPSDRPFRPFRLTDSLLGYLLLAFLFAVSVYVLISLVGPDVIGEEAAVALSAVAFVLAVAVEQTVLVVAGKRATPTAAGPSTRR
jgi:hypothetical protein